MKQIASLEAFYQRENGEGMSVEMKQTPEIVSGWHRQIQDVAREELARASDDNLRSLIEECCAVLASGKQPEYHVGPTMLAALLALETRGALPPGSRGIQYKLETIQ